MIFEPVDFIGKLTELVHRTQVNPTRYHGVFAANSCHSARVTPPKRGKGSSPSAPDELPERPLRKQRPLRRGPKDGLRQIRLGDIPVGGFVFSHSPIGDTICGRR